MRILLAAVLAVFATTVRDRADRLFPGLDTASGRRLGPAGEPDGDAKRATGRLAGRRSHAVHALTTDPNRERWNGRTLDPQQLLQLRRRTLRSTAQANKFAQRHVWAGVFEIQDHTGTGGFYGVEIDAFTQGPSAFPGSQQGDRVGLGIVLGRAGYTGPKATIDYGILIAPAGSTTRRPTSTTA